MADKGDAESGLRPPRLGNAYAMADKGDAESGLRPPRLGNAYAMADYAGCAR